METSRAYQDRAEEILPWATIVALAEADNSLQDAPWLVWDDGDLGTAYPVTRDLRDRRTGQVRSVTVESDWIANCEPATAERLALLRNSISPLLDRLALAEGELERLRGELERSRPPF